jgi:alkylated DNA repair dioxygenase AlkB
VFVQPSLLDTGVPSFDGSFSELLRDELDEWSWLDHQTGWLSGSDVVFDELLERLTWNRPEVQMYDRKLEQPRSTAGFAIGERFDFPYIDAMAAALGDRYGVAFRSVWCNLYCDGHDSVAWHGDRVLRDRSDGLVVIVSVGHRRRFLIKPAGGGPSRAFELGRGDLFAMGGDCQRRWRHCVPKVSPASLVGPRISITMRPG